VGIPKYTFIICPGCIRVNSIFTSVKLITLFLKMLLFRAIIRGEQELPLLNYKI